jgi:hypothetical protein
MEAKARYDLFEPGDQTALVCIDDPEIHNVVAEQLAALEYKIHTGLFPEDVSLKLKTHAYEVVIIYENFNGADLETNQILAEALAIPAAQRRSQVLVLIGPTLVTNDEMQAFYYSVDMVVSVMDLANLRPVVRRGVARHAEFYRVFNECVKMAGMS